MARERVFRMTETFRHIPYDFCILCIAIIAILAISLAIHYRKQRNRSLFNCNELERRHCKVHVSNLNDCRLINIARNGRMNVLTFQRGATIFNIETMGLLSDNTDEWRALAGLDQ